MRVGYYQYHPEFGAPKRNFEKVEDSLAGVDAEFLFCLSLHLRDTSSRTVTSCENWPKMYLNLLLFMVYRDFVETTICSRIGDQSFMILLFELL